MTSKSCFLDWPQPFFQTGVSILPTATLSCFGAALAANACKAYQPSVSQHLPGLSRHIWQLHKRIIMDMQTRQTYRLSWVHTHLGQERLWNRCHTQATGMSKVDSLNKLHLPKAKGPMCKRCPTHFHAISASSLSISSESAHMVMGMESMKYSDLRMIAAGLANRQGPASPCVTSTANPSLPHFNKL